MESLSPEDADTLEFTILLPCLNEAQTVATCVEKARDFLGRNRIRGEVLVADNGSTDGSQALATAHAARVVDVRPAGYGAALLGGIQSARGRFVIMGDADDSYDFSDLSSFVARLRDGDDLVMGNRFHGGIAKGAMPLLHKYLGNPVLTAIGRLFFRSPVRDFHCGLRGFRRDAVLALGLRATGMEFASEMVVKATLHGLRMSEVPTRLARDGRGRPPHLRSWRDGWRHLRFLLMYSPRWLFLYPGLFLTGAGLLGLVLLLPGAVTVGSTVFDIHTMLLMSMLIVLGTQTLTFAWLAKQYGTDEGLLPPDPAFDSWREFASVERLALLGAVFVALGGLGILSAVAFWRSRHFGGLDASRVMRLIVPSVTLIITGAQAFLAGFLSGILTIRVRREPT